MCLMCEPYRIKCQNLSHFNVHSSKHLNPHSSMHLNTFKRVFQLFNIVVDNLMHYVKVCCSFFFLTRLNSTAYSPTHIVLIVILSITKYILLPTKIELIRFQILHTQ